ncbi:MAG: YybH family protein [Pseudonocardiaceae bacterium]
MTEKTAPDVIRIERLEDAGRVFQDTFNAGDVDGLVNLFEPDAVLVPAPGQATVGSDAIREVFAGFLATWERFEIKVFSRHQVGDIALITAEWKVEGKDPDGNPVTLRARPAIVFRRQADGSWRFLIDNAFPFD